MKWEIDWKRIMPSTLYPIPRTLRRAQTTVEYLLVMAALTVAFFMVYKVLQYSLTRQFKTGGVIVLRMYSQPYTP